MDFELTYPGLYEVTVEVSGVEGQGYTSFDMEVLPLQLYEWNRVMFAVGGVVAVMGWMLWRKRANLYKGV